MNMIKDPMMTLVTIGVMLGMPDMAHASGAIAPCNGLVSYILLLGVLGVVAVLPVVVTLSVHTVSIGAIKRHGSQRFRDMWASKGRCQARADGGPSS